MDIRPTPFRFRRGAAERAYPAVPALFRGPPKAPTLTLSASEMDAQVDQLAAVRVTLNAPVGLWARGQRMAVLVNPQVLRVGRNLVAEAPHLGQVYKNAGVDTAGLKTSVDKLIGLAACYQASVRGQARVQVSRGLTARALRLVSDDILAAAQHLLSVNDLKPELRARLQAGLLPIEAAQGKKRADEQRRRNATVNATERTQAELERLDARDLLQKVLDDLRAGRTVDPVAAAQALRTHDSLKEEREVAAAQAGSEPKAKKPKASNRRSGNRP